MIERKVLLYPAETAAGIGDKNVDVSGEQTDLFIFLRLWLVGAQQMPTTERLYTGEGGGALW